MTILCPECNHPINEHNGFLEGSEGCFEEIDSFETKCPCVLTPQDIAERIVEEAVEACNSTLRWLDDFGRHAPIIFGGEQELHDKMQEFIQKYQVS